MESQKEVLAHGPLEQQAFVVPVLRNDRHAQSPNLRGARCGYVLAENADPSAGAATAFPRVQEGFQQLRLAVALHAGDADDLTAPDSEADFREPVATAGQSRQA